MKKLILILAILCLTNFVKSQVSDKAVIPNKVIHNEVSTLPDAPKPVYQAVKIDTVKQAIVSKDTMQVLDSTIRTQGNVIIDKQDSLVKEIAKSESIINGIKDGTFTFISLINWLFIAVFIIITWLFNDLIEAKNTGTKLNWFNKIPKMLRSFIVGLLIAVIFYFTYTDDNNRLNVFSLFVSLISGMVIYKIGINNILAIVSKKVLGLDLTSEKKIETKEESKPTTNT